MTAAESAPPVTVADAIRSATRALTEAGIPDAVGDARRLVAHAMELTPEALAGALNDRVTPAGMLALDKAVTQRLERRPMAHILGRRAFWGRDFKVTEAVLDPRPETETLIRAALDGPFQTVLDLGTGSGCILLTLLAEREGARGTGADISEAALKVAAENRARLGLDRQAVFVVSDWFSNVVGQFDMIVANPPYVGLAEMGELAPEVRKWEPMAALTPGITGFEAYEAIAAGIMDHLAPGGRALFEVGPAQAPRVQGIMAAAGLAPVAVHKDMDGRDRVVELQRPA